MKIIKISKDNDQTGMFCNCTCANCHEAEAEVSLFIGGQVVNLCLGCTWDLEDMLNATTFVDFEHAEK